MMRQYHPAAALFPLLSDKEIGELAESIKTGGLRLPIVLANDGTVLDGRNRLLACQLAGVKPSFVTYRGDDPVGEVVRLNLHRRHLNESQRAMAAARVATMRQGARTDLSPIGEKSQAQAAELLSVGKRTVERARQVQEKCSPEVVAKVDRGELAVSAALREVNRREKVRQLAAAGTPALGGSRLYTILLGDPPWEYEHSETESREIENHYPTMALEEICDLRVTDVCTDDALLFLWATSPKLAEAMQVIEAWDFAYRTCAVWVKDKIGMGYYFRQQHELLLVAARGSPPKPAPGNRASSVIEAPRLGHSKKPEKVHATIERMYPELAKLELFARAKRDGWDVWGNQA
jgi:N6-adenosine-specific RNA methylase IME4